MLFPKKTSLLLWYTPEVVFFNSFTTHTAPMCLCTLRNSWCLWVSPIKAVFQTKCLPIHLQSHLLLWLWKWHIYHQKSLINTISSVCAASWWNNKVKCFSTAKHSWQICKASCTGGLWYGKCWKNQLRHYHQCFVQLNS